MNSHIQQMNIVVVSRQEPLRKQAREAYEEMGHLVLTTTSTEQVLSLMEGRNPTLRNSILVDVGGFANATLIELVGRLSAVDPTQDEALGWKTRVILMIEEDAAIQSIPDAIDLGNLRGGVCVKVMKSKGAWQDFWRVVYTPGEDGSPPKSFPWSLIEPLMGQLRAVWG